MAIMEILGASLMMCRVAAAIQQCQARYIEELRCILRYPLDPNPNALGVRVGS